MNMITRVIAVQLPATCPRNCKDFCRTPNHGEGDAVAVVHAVRPLIVPNCETHFTSNGETGNSPIYRSLSATAKNMGAFLSALGVVAESVHADLCRFEASWNRYTHKDAAKAIEKCHDLRIPVVLSLIDDGVEKNDTDALVEKHRASGFIIREKQAEGLSNERRGMTRWWIRPGVFLGACPIFSYGEFRKKTPPYELINIDHFGRRVDFLGSPQRIAA